MLRLNVTRCPFCERVITEDCPLRFSGAHILGCARCYGTRPLKVRRAVRPAVAGFALRSARMVTRRIA